MTPDNADYVNGSRREDDPAGTFDGYRAPFLYQQELQEWDALVEEHGLGCWDCDRVKEWLSR
jgi:hypothetical protein